MTPGRTWDHTKYKKAQPIDFKKKFSLLTDPANNPFNPKPSEESSGKPTEAEMMAAFDDQAPNTSGKAVRNVPKEEGGLSAVEIAMIGDKALEDVMPGIAPEKKQEAFIKAGKVKEGEASPETRAALRQLSQNPEEAEAVVAARRSQGADDGDTGSALLSLVFGALVGGAVGGKRGALAAIKGGGQYVVDEMKADKEAEREEKKYQARQEDSLEKSKELINYRAEIQDEIARAKKREEGYWESIPVDDKKRISATPGILDTLDDVATDFEKLGDKPFSFQLKKLVSGTPEYTAVSKLTYLVPRLVRISGDTGNIALAERGITKEALEGNFTSSGADAALRLREVREIINEEALEKLRSYRDSYSKGGEAVEASLENRKGRGIGSASQQASLKRWRELNASRALVRKKIEQLGWDVSDEVLDEMGFE